MTRKLSLRKCPEFDIEKWIHGKYRGEDNLFKASKKSCVQILTDACGDQKKALVSITNQRRDIIELG